MRRDSHGSTKNCLNPNWKNCTRSIPAFRANNFAALSLRLCSLVEGECQTADDSAERVICGKNTCCVRGRFRVVKRSSKVLRASFGEVASQVQQFKTAV